MNFKRIFNLEVPKKFDQNFRTHEANKNNSFESPVEKRPEVENFPKKEF